MAELELEPRFSAFPANELCTAHPLGGTVHKPSTSTRKTSSEPQKNSRQTPPNLDLSPTSLQQYLFCCLDVWRAPYSAYIVQAVGEDHTGNPLSGTHLKPTNDSNCSEDANTKKGCQPSASTSKQRTKTSFKGNANVSLSSVNPTLPNDPICSKDQSDSWESLHKS